jgi:sugar lactone lactonase YvrE
VGGRELVGVIGPIGRGRVSRLSLVATLIVCVVAVFGIDGSTASAATPTSSYGYLTTFGEELFAEPGGSTQVAVGQATGNIFSSRRQLELVDVFAPDPTAGGTLLGSIEVGGAHPGASENIAVDPTDDSLYVAESQFGSTIAKYVSDHGSPPVYSYDPTFAPSPLLTVPKGLAVDPLTHDLLVVDGASNQILRLSATDGSQLSSFSIPVNPRGIAAGPTGTIYAIASNGASVESYSSSGVPQGALPVPAGSNAQAVAVEPQTGDIALVIALTGQIYLEGLNQAGAEQFRSRIPSGLLSQARGLAWDENSERIYAAVGNGRVLTFVPTTAAGLDAPVVSSSSISSAHVTAEVAPAGVSTTAHIEYCPATAACDEYLVSDPGDVNNPWRRGPEHENLSAPGPIEDDLPLSANASWRIRVAATSADVNGVLTESVSPVVSFDSPLVAPGVTTGAAGSITTDAAELTGTIDSVGSQTTFHFEYGLTTAYGLSVPAGGEANAGNSRTPRDVSRAVAGLQPGTTYHFRLVAKNAAGESAGVDRTFTTLAVEPPARSYEQVTPVDKKGATINSLIGFQAAADGSALSYALASAPRDAPSSVLYTRYFSRRGSSDWAQWESTDPPLNVGRGITETATQAVSSDFTKAMVVSNRALTPVGPNGPFVGGGNVYIKDLRTGSLTFIGGSAASFAFTAMTGPQKENMFLAGASNFSWITFMAPASLLPGAPTTALYHWSPNEGLTLQSLSAGEVHMPTAGLELTSRWVSDDGSIMYYNFLGGPVYRHELNGATTPISVVRDGPEAGSVLNGKIDGISRDGRYAFFRAGPLTTKAQEEGEGAYLYRYDAQTGELDTAGQVVFGLPGGVLGVGDDGRTAFFDDGAGLSSWRDGVTHHFTSAQPDLGSPGTGYEVFSSTNGRYLVYWNGDGTVHRYDAVTQVDACVSCLPDGSGGRDANLPVGLRSVSNREPAVVLDDGTTFFDTTTRLLAADHNGSRDVYAYKDGALTLISPGDGAFTARFADATPDGSNVYFTTDQGLVAQDTDQSTDVYDYRLGGGFPGQSAPPPPKACGGDDCQGLPGLSPAGPFVDSANPPFSGKPPGGSARASVSGAKIVTGSSGTLRVRVSGGGRIQVSGSGIRRASVKAGKGGTYRIPVRLSKRSRQILKDEHRLKLKLTVRFTPSSGEPVSVHTDVTFKQPQAKA